MKKRRIAENIYDVLKAIPLPVKQVNPWAELSRKHEKEAKKELSKYLKCKSMEWENNTIRIGKHVTITVH